MADTTPDIRNIILDTVKPQLTNIRDLLRGEIDRLRDDVNDIVTNKVQPIEDKLNAHINNKNNPHVVTPAQIFTFSAAAPTNSQGKVGDVWIQYHTLTVDQM